MGPDNQPRSNIPKPACPAFSLFSSPERDQRSCDITSDLIVDALTDPLKFFNSPDEALDISRSNPSLLTLARAAMVGFALESDNYQREGWYGLFDIDPHGARITAAAFALLGESRRAEIAFEALADSDLSLAAACAPKIIAKDDYLLIGRALAILAAYDLGSAQTLARKLDPKGYSDIYVNRARILEQPAAEAKPLPLIPFEVYALGSTLCIPTLDRAGLERSLRDPRAATTPMLACLLRSTIRDQGQPDNFMQSSLIEYLEAGLRKDRDSEVQPHSFLQFTTSDFYLNCVTASALHRILSEMPARDSEQNQIEVGQSQSNEPERGRYMQEMLPYLSGEFAPLKQALETEDAAQISNPVLLIMRAQVSAEKGRIEESERLAKRALELSNISRL